MKAIHYSEYGALDEVLALRDIDKPTPKDDEVLVRTRAAGLHVGDCFGVRGAPFAMRLSTGLLRPNVGIPGYDVAGQVEAVGDSVKRFQPGDEVFGACNGTCAEYVAREKTSSRGSRPASRLRKRPLCRPPHSPPFTPFATSER